VAQHYVLDALACHAASTGRPALAARLLGAADTVRMGGGAAVIRTIAPVVADAKNATEVALGSSRFEAEYGAGKKLSRSGAIALALGERSHEAPATSHDGFGPLGKREAEVASLVADGLSNKQIGARLFISERTVDGHVRNIVNKLGFSSRAQLAAWISSGR
jgi:DNA-binding NarL/FixJ family response regulator